MTCMWSIKPPRNFRYAYDMQNHRALATPWNYCGQENDIQCKCCLKSLPLLEKATVGWTKDILKQTASNQSSKKICKTVMSAMQLLKLELDVFSAAVFVTNNYELNTFIIRVIPHLPCQSWAKTTSWNDVGTWLLTVTPGAYKNAINPNAQSPNHSISKKTLMPACSQAETL